MLSKLKLNCNDQAADTSAASSQAAMQPSIACSAALCRTCMKSPCITPTTAPMRMRTRQAGSLLHNSGDGQTTYLLQAVPPAAVTCSHEGPAFVPDRHQKLSTSSICKNHGGPAFGLYSHGKSRPGNKRTSSTQISGPMQKKYTRSAAAVTRTWVGQQSSSSSEDQGSRPWWYRARHI